MGLFDIFKSGDAADCYKKGSDLTIAGQYHEAIEHFNKAINLDPTMVEAYGGLGVAYSALKQNKQAAISFNQYLRFSNNKFGDADVIRKKIKDLGFLPNY